MTCTGITSSLDKPKVLGYTSNLAPAEYDLRLWCVNFLFYLGDDLGMDPENTIQIWINCKTEKRGLSEKAHWTKQIKDNELSEPKN